MLTPDTSPKAVAAVLCIELEDLQAAQLAYLRDTQERQMIPDADKVRRMNDRALLLFALAKALTATPWQGRVERAAMALHHKDAMRASPFNGFGMAHCREWAEIALRAGAPEYAPVDGEGL